MVRRLFASLLTVVALACASGAWLGWLFQHTAGDPGGSQQLAAAVLADPTARHELAGDLSVAMAGAANDALVRTFGPQVPIRLDGHDPQVQKVAENVLADPQFAATITAAVAHAHANALGVGTSQPVVLDSAMVTAAARQYLATIDPKLAAEVPTIPSIAVNLPAAAVPIASKLRAATEEWVPRLEVIAITCLIGALVFGERAKVMRRAGIWGIGAGTMWLLSPMLVSWAADTWVPGHRAIVQALFRGVGGPVHTVAVNLIVMGGLTTAASIALSILRHTKPDTPGVTTGALIVDTHEYPDAAQRFGYAGRTESVETPTPTAGRH